VIILASGKNIAPQKVENLLRGQPSISNAMAFGDRHPYLVALITLDRPALARATPSWRRPPRARRRSASSSPPRSRLSTRQLARFEQVKRFAIVEPDFTPEGGELTLTMKLKRRVIEAKHRDTLTELYSEPQAGDR